MIVSTRLSNDLTAEIDRIAASSGQSRAAWMANILARAALSSENDTAAIMPPQSEGLPDDRLRVTIRLSRREIEAIDAVGSPLGLTRHEWIRRALRWQLWDKAGALRLAPGTQAELGKLRKQVLVINRNINQAVHAMNAANKAERSPDIARIASPFMEACGDLKAILFDTRRALSSYVGGEVGYWIGAFKDTSK